MSFESIEIAHRFCGPPQSGNGGYVGGRLAPFVATDEDTPAVAARLFAPPPLGTKLEVRAEGDRFGLFAEGTRVAEARSVALDLVAPEAPNFEDAQRASEDFRGFHDPVFPTCFVCGFEREAGDGMRIFPGESEQPGIFAAPWVPDASLGSDGSDRVAPEFLWAALDCPGAFAFPQPEEKVVLLGEMQVQLTGDVSVGESCVVASWFLDRSGRKYTTGSALYNSAGRCCGVAKGIWIEIEPDAVPRS